jgi:type I restriction enzyme, S subunit
MEVKTRFKQTEVGIIPYDWNLCSVGSKGEVLTGKALAVNGPGLQRPYLRTKNVYDGQIDIEDVLTMPISDTLFDHFLIKNNDALLNEGQSLELVGRCAIYQGEYPEPCAIQNQLLRFRAHTGVSAAFASHLFRYCQQTGVFTRIALQTTSIAHLGGERFERMILAWPPTEVEQIAIAKALSNVDALINSLDRLIAKKRDIKQAAMQQLLTGKKRLPGFYDNWETQQLSDLAEIVSGGTPQTGKLTYWHGSIKWCTPTDITNCSTKYLFNT